VSTVLPGQEVRIDFGRVSNHHDAPPKMTAESPSQKSPRISALLQSGMIFAAISFATSLGNFAFQRVLGVGLNTQGDYGDANAAIGALIPLLGLLPATASIAVTHYIAHFNHCGDAARLQGLLLGCRKFLFQLTVVGTVLTLIVIKPLTHHFFGDNESMMLAVLIGTLFNLWSAFAIALCSGLGWFKRLALIGFLAMLMKIGFGWLGTRLWPSAEIAVLATAFALLANLLLLCWRKELKLSGVPISPWNREFTHFLVVSAAFTMGNFCFFQGDWLVAQQYFSKTDRDAYSATAVLARALPVTIAPLLAVLFTSRSGQRAGNVVREQLKLLGLSGFGLICGAICLFLLRTLCLKAIGRNTPEAAASIAPFAVTMVFVGLLQSLAFWVLASRWLKTSILYGALGLGYWLVLLNVGKTPAALLHAMPITSAFAFVVLFIAWLNAMRQHRAKAD
jgi:hypothetical protein